MTRVIRKTPETEHSHSEDKDGRETDQESSSEINSCLLADIRSGDLAKIVKGQ